MKNQYFGDKRDLFKYDIISRIMKAKPFSLKQFLFIPMLTPNDNSMHGELRDFRKTDPGYNNEGLRRIYLEPSHHIPKGQRDFRKIVDYFSEENIKSEIYDHHNGESFRNKERRLYFKKVREKIKNSCLSKLTLLFLDPDTGIQPNTRIQNANVTDKHVQYSEIKDLYKEIKDDASIIMVIQFFRRKKGETRQFFIKHCKEHLHNEARAKYVSYICDKQATLFFLTKNNKQRENLRILFAEYKKEYPKCYFG